MSNTILGLDIGPNSIGWALLGCNDEGDPNSIQQTGVRVFQEAVDAKGREPKKKTRRDKRLSRRTLRRRVLRKNRLADLLIGQNFFTNRQQMEEFITSAQFDPWALRVKGLDEQLTLQEFGRVLYHFAQRRGFLSTRKGESKKKPNTDLKIKRSNLERELEASGYRTFAEYIVRNNLPKRKQEPVREMYKSEFDLLWEKQRQFHPDVLTQSFQAQVHRAIFFQRHTYLKPNTVGYCIFETKKPRAMKGTLQFQEFRIRQDINNLKTIDTLTGELREISANEKQKLFEYMNVRKEAKWDQIRKLLGLIEDVKFNLEGSKSKLVGNETNAPLSKILKEQWEDMKSQAGYYSWQTKQDALVEDLLTIEKTEDLYNRLTDPNKFWKFDEETARKLSEVELPDKYGKLSLKAIRKILPFLHAGKIYSEACKEAGYDHSNPTKVQQVTVLPLPDDLRNPVVNKALHEVRKLVNSIIRVYGLPTTIRVELAREVKLTGEDLVKSNSEKKRREKENQEIKEILTKEFSKEFSCSSPSNDAIIRYRLWKECEGICPYTGTRITRDMLFSNDVDVEHILPYSRTFDNSQRNKTLCMAKENREVKKNQTPYEAYHQSSKYEEILHRVAKFPRNKRVRFSMTEIPDDFVERQLNDTRYISREVSSYLKQLGCDVEVTKGKITYDMRYYWELNLILNKNGENEKNRDDHRHHAVDALIIALTNRKRYTLIQKLFGMEGVYGAEALKKKAFEKFPVPWENFYQDVKKSIESIIVSHAPYRKVAGAFCEETAYGKTSEKNVFTFRKPISSLTEADIRDHAIRDKVVREIIEKRFLECGGKIDNYTKNDKKHNENVMKKAFGSSSAPLFHKNGKTPIHSVRVLVTFDEKKLLKVKDAKDNVYKYYPLGNNHHYELFIDDTTNKKVGRLVTTFDAIDRIRNKQPIIDRTPPENGYRFLCSLIINDMVEREVDGKKFYYRVQKLTDGQITMRLHTASTLENNSERWLAAPNKFDGRKVQVDLLGNVWYAND